MRQRIATSASSSECVVGMRLIAMRTVRTTSSEFVNLSLAKSESEREVVS